MKAKLIHESLNEFGKGVNPMNTMHIGKHSIVYPIFKEIVDDNIISLSDMNDDSQYQENLNLALEWTTQNDSDKYIDILLDAGADFTSMNYHAAVNAVFNVNFDILNKFIDRGLKLKDLTAIVKEVYDEDDEEDNWTLYKAILKQNKNKIKKSK